MWSGGQLQVLDIQQTVVASVTVYQAVVRLSTVYLDTVPPDKQLHIPGHDENFIGSSDSRGKDKMQFHEAEIQAEKVKTKKYKMELALHHLILLVTKYYFQISNVTSSCN